MILKKYGNTFASVLNSLLTVKDQTKEGVRLRTKFVLTCNPKVITKIFNDKSMARSIVAQRMVSHVGAEDFLVTQEDDRAKIKLQELKEVLNNRTYKKILDELLVNLDLLIDNEVDKTNKIDLYFIIRNSIQVSFLNHFLGIEYNNLKDNLKNKGFKEKLHKLNELSLEQGESLEKLFILNYFYLPKWLKNIFSPYLKEKNKVFEDVVETIYREATVKPNSWLAKLKELEKNKMLTHKEVTGEIRGVFINANTLAISLVNCLYRLYKNNPVYIDNIKKSLSYARYCYMESLRLDPPFKIISKEKRSKCPFHRKEIYVISAKYAHRNHLYWEKPNDFNPLRFKNGLSKIEKGSYIPFGGGERICTGVAMTMYLAPKILFHLFNKYVFREMEPPIIGDIGQKLTQKSVFYTKILRI